VTFTIRDWRDAPDASTPITAAALEDLETRLSAYTDALSADPRIPTQAENDALAGTNGAPSGTNAFVTNSDPRLFAISVKAAPYNAAGDGTTNDQAAIQAAINAAAGRPVYLPPGSYRINTPLRMKPRTHLFADDSPMLMYPEWPTRTQLIAGSGWSGAAMIECYETSITGDGAAPNGCRIDGLLLNCNNLAARGIYWRGDARDYTLRDVEVAYFTTAGYVSEGNGANPSQELNFWHCHASLGGAGAAGWIFQSASYDHRLVGCVSHTNGGDGFQVLAGSSSIELASCRAEWNGGHGFLLYGPTGGAGIGKVTLNGCVTDANEQNGIYIEHAIAGAGPILINGHYSNRDGNNGGSGARAGIRVHGCSQPVIISGLAQRTGFNDGGGGIERPKYGVDCTGTSTHVAINGYLDGVTTGFHNDGTCTVKWMGGAWLEDAGVRTWQASS
jgi:hypothetical protein